MEDLSQVMEVVVDLETEAVRGMNLKTTMKTLETAVVVVTEAVKVVAADSVVDSAGEAVEHLRAP